MIRYSYVNGRYAPHRDAFVHIEDRGFQFSDGVYEVAAFYNRILVDGDLHWQRLFRSLAALDIPKPMSEAALMAVVAELIHRNDLQHGSVYLQVTRGVAKRDHVYKAGLKPSLIISASKEKKINPKEVKEGGEAICRPDIRWQRRDIKSISLLANMLLKNEASRQGKREVWLTNEKGFVTEASVSNAFIVNQKGELQTHPEDNCLLSGITRHRILTLAREIGVKIREKPFTQEEVYHAREAFISASTSHIVPIVAMDDCSICNGHPGEITLRIFAAYVNYIEQCTGQRIWQP